MGLIRGWLRAGVVTGNSLLHPEAGTPQGGVISPLLANIVLNRLDQAWEARHGRLGELTRYADDLVIVCRSAGRAREALRALAKLLNELGLSLSPTKTRIVDCRDGSEGFDFLGFHFRWIPSRRNPKRRFAAAWPSKAAMSAARERIRELTPLERVGLPTIISSSRIRSDRPAADRRIPHGPHISAAVFGRGRPVPGGRRRNRELLIMVVEDLNAFLRGWGAYFRFGNSTRAFRAIDSFVFERVARFHARKHGSRTWKQGMVDLIESKDGLGIYRLGGTVRNRVAHAAR